MPKKYDTKDVLSAFDEALDDKPEKLEPKITARDIVEERYEALNKMISVEGYSYDQVASWMTEKVGVQVSSNTLKTYMVRAKRRRTIKNKEKEPKNPAAIPAPLSSSKKIPSPDASKMTVDADVERDS